MLPDTITAHKCTPQITAWHVPISGFTQTLDRSNGIHKLWTKLRAVVDKQTCVIHPQVWNANFAELAEFIWMMSQGNGAPAIKVYAYSWGCGHGFIRLAKELRRRGMRIRTAVLCDPVFHSWWRPWRAMILCPQIVVPSNVDEVFWFRQYQNRPCGTALMEADEDQTEIHEAIVLDREHAYMDDAQEFHECCVQAAKDNSK